MLLTQAEAIRGRPRDHRAIRQWSDVPVTYADASKAKALLGWEAAVGIEDGLARFVAWYAAEGRAHDEFYTAGAWHGSA